MWASDPIITPMGGEVKYQSEKSNELIVALCEQVGAV